LYKLYSVSNIKHSGIYIKCNELKDALFNNINENERPTNWSESHVEFSEYSRSYSKESVEFSVKGSINGSINGSFNEFIHSEEIKIKKNSK